MKKRGINSDKNLLLFFTFALGGTWLFGLIPYFLGILNTSLGNFLFYFGAAAPSITGIALVLSTCPKDYRNNYFRRCFNIKAIGMKWALWVITYFTLISIIGITIARIFFGYPIPEMSWAKMMLEKPYMLLLFLLLSLVSGPINEEFGWRGYSLDRLFVRFGFIKSNIILGTVWAVWHLCWFIKPEQVQYAWLQHSIFVTISYLPSTIMLTFIVSYIYIMTNRSIFAGAFVHMMSNFLTSQLLSPSSIDTFFVITVVQIVLSLCVVIYISQSKKFMNRFKLILNDINNESSSL